MRRSPVSAYADTGDRVMNASDHMKGVEAPAGNVAGREAPAGKIGACFVLIAHNPPKVAKTLIFGRAFFKKLAGCGAGPTYTAFLFCQAFFFGPTASKEKSVKRAFLAGYG